MLKLSLWVSLVALILGAICGAGGAQTTEPDSGQTLPVHSREAHPSNGPDVPTLQDRHPRYQVMPSDVLAISFPLIPEIPTTAVAVQPDGYITLPSGAGNMYVKGSTVPQIVEALTKVYSKTMHNPIVNVDITNFQPPLFTVDGQVGKPGQYPLRNDTTVSEGIAVAGGLLPSGKTHVFLFHRISSDWVEVKKINLGELLNGHNIREDTHLQAGDMIFVPDTFISKFRRYVPYGLNSGVGWSGNALLK